MAQILDSLRKDPGRVMFIDQPISPIITGGAAYLSRTGQSVAVTLYGPANPQGLPRPSFKVYLPIEVAQWAEEPKHLLNAASHKAMRWMDAVKADYWHLMLVEACRPMRANCRPLLQSIATTARNKWGTKYWRNAQAREMLDRELRMMGVKTPPPASILDFLPLIPLEKKIHE